MNLPNKSKEYDIQIYFGIIKLSSCVTITKLSIYGKSLKERYGLTKDWNEKLE